MRSEPEHRLVAANGISAHAPAATDRSFAEARRRWPEIPIVEHDRVEAGTSKRLGEGIQALLLHGRVDVVARTLDRDPQSSRRAAGCRV